MKRSAKPTRTRCVKRDLFAEMDALADTRHDKRTLRTHSVKPRESRNSRDEQISVSVFPNGEPEPPDINWSMATMEERIEGVWTLTKLAMGWNESSDVPRMQKTITRVIRGKH